MNEFSTLAQGAELSPETWADFVKRLHEGVRGNRVKDHCTADAIFEVQELRAVYGIDLDYADSKCAFFNEDSELSFTCADDWYNHFEESERLEIDAETEDGFLNLSGCEKWELIENFDGWTVTGYCEKWEPVCTHLTYEAAEAFISRKKHDYKKLQIFVESRYMSWEFNTIINGILDGKIVLANADKSSEVAA